MTDLIYLGLTLFFFLISIGFVVGAQYLMEE